MVAGPYAHTVQPNKIYHLPAEAEKEQILPESSLHGPGKLIMSSISLLVGSGCGRQFKISSICTQHTFLPGQTPRHIEGAIPCWHVLLQSFNGLPLLDLYILESRICQR